MKSNRKIKIIVPIILGILFAFSPIITPNLDFKNSDISDCVNLDNENLKNSALSPPIHIDDTNPSMNWSVAKDTGICTGNGTYSKPYVIEDLVIDGGGSVNCILIENSEVYFRIENCTLYNSSLAGIQLSNVKLSQLADNNCTTNFKGISLEFCYNNTISGNTVNYNNYFGISLDESDYCMVAGNNLKYNPIGLYLSGSTYNTILGNNASYNGDNGITLYDSDNNNISGNTVNFNHDVGIFLYNCNNNTVSENIVNNNEHGIYLWYSNDNKVSGNILLGNDKCIVEDDDCHGNKFSDNGACIYGQGGGIPGYKLFFLLAFFSVIVIILSKKAKKS